LAFTSDGKKLLSGGADNTIKIWDVENGKELIALKGHSGPILQIGIAPDGKTAYSASKDGTLKIWDVATGTDKTVLSGELFSTVRFSPKANTVAIVRGNLVRLRDLTKQKKERAIKVEGGISCAEFSPDGKTIAFSRNIRGRE
jgi:WD40 repeat protein